MAPPGVADALAASRAAALRERLARTVTAHEFAQVVRALERLHPERAPVGGFGDPADEVARFAAHPSLAFPPSDVEAVRFPDDGPPAVEVNFLGLVGPAGVLPRGYTQYVAERAALRDTALRDFLDLFHHRLASLFYRAWRVGAPHAAVGEPGDADRLTAHLRALLGLGTPALQERLAVPDGTLLHHVALLAPRVRSAAALGHLLAAHFAVPCAVEEFVGAWYPLAAGTQCALGLDDATTALGVGSVVGDAAWDHQARVRVRLGPMSGARLAAFLPGRRGHDALRALVRYAADDAVEVEVRLLLAPDAVPPIVLGTPPPGGPPLGGLGRGSWLSTRPPAHAPDDVSFLL